MPAAPTAEALEIPSTSVLDDPIEQRRFTRFIVAADGSQVAESALRISGMTCAACAIDIENALSRLPGVVRSSVSAAGGRAQVRWRPGATGVAAIVEAIGRAGYGAVPDTAHEASAQRRAQSRMALWRLFVAAFCAMQVMMLATPSYVSGTGDLETDLRSLLNWGQWTLTLPVLAFSAGPFFTAAWRGLRRRAIVMDLPVALGLIVTFVASTGATFDPAGIFGQEVYFDSLTMFVSFLLGGRWLETRARHRVAQVLEDAMQGMPQTALRLAASGAPERVSVQRLQAGDRVLVPVGDAFPADGELLEGSTRADEALLTGESRPVDKRAGDEVIAGSMNLGAPVTLVVRRCGTDTRLEGIVALMRDAMSQRPEAARMADRWAGPFLGVVLLLALAAGTAWATVEPAKAVWVMVSVLIVTCPCALSLAVPAALLAATSALARRGVLLQRIDALDTMTRIDRFYLDKTGTVTSERMSLRAVRVLNADAAAGQRLHEQAATLARSSGHPLSKALAATARPGGGAPWRDVQEVPGRGIHALDAAGAEWRLGSADFVGAADGGTDAEASVWFGCGGQAAVRFDFDESARPDAGEAVAQWRARGLQVTLLSGDRDQRVRRLADEIGVDRAIGSATPESKLAEVQKAQADGHRVAMIGDGINDAPVLARSDLSFAMGSAALLARARADAIVTNDRLTDITAAWDIAQRARRVVRQNLAWAAAYNLASVPMALAGWLPPWAAGLGMASSSLLVILNSLRLARA